jgi:hypothetical protein
VRVRWAPCKATELPHRKGRVETSAKRGVREGNLSGWAALALDFQDDLLLSEVLAVVLAMKCIG